MASKNMGRLWKDIAKLAFEVLNTEQLQKEIENLGHSHFIDPSFPPNDSSIYDITSGEEYPFSDRAVWKRPKEFMKETPELFKGDINPNDISQGGLGDCWFLASIASVAEFPVYIEKLFITKSYNEFGIYKLRICKNGEWVDVTIDDYIPCKDSGEPLFTSSKDNELWVLLLEKAYAKLHGSYAQLREGYVTHALMDLTGCPTSKYNFPIDRSDFRQIKEYANNLWYVIKEADESNFIMCAGTPGVDIFTEGGGPQEDHGIVPGHAYSVIQAKEYKGIRLLNVRNPWGEFEWGGAWSDNDSHWTDETIKYFKPTFDEKDGAFWMSYDDFFMNFDSLTICKTQNWNELRLKGKFIRAIEDNDNSNDWVISQFCYSFEVKNKSSIVEIGLHQEDERIMGANKRPYLDISLVVLKRSSDGTFSIEAIADNETVRDLEAEFTLEQGYYVVVPLTTGGFLKAPNIPSSPVKLKVDIEGTQIINPQASSAINDLFSKIDMQMDGILTERELNQFGKIVNDPYFSSLTQESFSSEEFKNVSCNENGVSIHCLLNC